jgi:hypothetical protein
VVSGKTEEFWREIRNHYVILDKWYLDVFDSQTSEMGKWWFGVGQGDKLMMNWLRMLQISVIQVAAVLPWSGSCAEWGGGLFVEGMNVAWIAQCIIDRWMSAEGTGGWTVGCTLHLVRWRFKGSAIPAGEGLWPVWCSTVMPLVGMCNNYTWSVPWCASPAGKFGRWVAEILGPQLLQWLKVTDILGTVSVPIIKISRVL